MHLSFMIKTLTCTYKENQKNNKGRVNNDGLTFSLNNNERKRELHKLDYDNIIVQY